MSNYSVITSDHLDIIDVSDTLQHASRHEGYYSPNYTDKKATPYIYDTLVKSSDGRQIGMRFKGVGDREWVIIYVPSVDFTPTYNNIIKLINDNKDISNKKVVIRENEKAKAARIVTNFFNSPSVAGNEKMTTFVKNPQHLKRSSSVSHSLFTEVYDMDEYLEHHGILGMKWGVRRYQNKDGSLTAEGRKHYNVKTVNSTRMELAGAESDREKRTIMTKATNKAVGDYAKGIMLGTGTVVAKEAAKQAVARAAMGNIVRNTVYNSLTGTSSVITSVLPAAVPGWAAALTTPVGQIALAAVGTVGAAKAVYGIYKAAKLNELAAEFDVSTNVNREIRDSRSISGSVERGMREYREDKANRMINALDSGNRAAYEKERNSFKDDHEKDSMEYIVDRVRVARQSGKYDMEFLERGLDQNQRTGEDLKGKDLDEAYLKYLLEKEK